MYLIFANSIPSDGVCPIMHCTASTKVHQRSNWNDTNKKENNNYIAEYCEIGRIRNTFEIIVDGEYCCGPNELQRGGAYGHKRISYLHVIYIAQRENML